MDPSWEFTSSTSWQVKATAPLGVGGGNSPRSARRWPGDRGERGERPPVAAVKAMGT